MDASVLYCTLLLLINYAAADGPYEALAAHSELKKQDPMVAFSCGSPAMYRTQAAGWVRDISTDCLTEAVDILDYCKKKYPDDEIRNIVEASEMYTITNWCPKSHKHCKHGQDKTVRPYRCLVGEFQSDPLLVPPHCNFSHEHNAKKCMDFFEWSASATGKCQEKNLHLQSFAMLQPCGLKVFTGVEFVCCPKTQTTGSMTRAEKTIELSEKETEPEQKKEKKSSSDKQKESKQTEMNAYEKYLRYSEDKHKNEHRRFRSAMTVWQEEHHEKIRNLMKDWSAARKHVTDLRSTDPNAATKLNKDLTERFQKMYQALEQDGVAKKRQLVAIHQQRIQAHLNLKKRTTMEKYIRALEDEQPTDVLRALEHYIRAEEKDRIHTVNHYEHVREIDSEDAQRIIPQTKDHLKVIEQRINQSMEMLQRVPQYKERISTQIHEFMKNYRTVDDTVKHVILSPDDSQVEEVENIPEDKENTIDYHYDNEKVNEDNAAVPGQKIDDGGLYDENNIIHVQPLHNTDVKEPEIIEPETTVTAEEGEKEKEQKQQPVLTEKEATSEHAGRVPKKTKKLTKDRFGVETSGGERKYVKVEKSKPVANHHYDSVMAVETSDAFVATTYSSGSGSGSVFAIALGSVAVFVIILVSIVIMRKKAQRTPTTTGFVEVEQPASPEEKHLANMQMNGYENPTYKYFETGTPKA